MRIERIHVDHAGGGGQRIQRMAGVVLRTEQALLLGGDIEEHHRTLRRRRLRKRAAHRDQRRGAGGVVDRAVVDAVAAGVRLADAQMIPVRAVDHGLVRVLAADYAADDVVRGDHALVDLEVGRQAFALECHRPERARLRLLLQRVEIQPGVLEHLHRQIALDPALELRVYLAGLVPHDVEHGVGVGVLHRGPAIRGRRGFVDHQQAERALAGGFLVLVGPAAVIGHRLAAEVAVAGLEVGVVDQDHGDLAAQVDAFEVVPVALRRLDAVTDEDQWGIADTHRSGAVHRGANGDLLALGQRLGLAAQLQTQRRLADDLGAQQGYGLCPQAGAVPEVATGLQAGRLHLRHHVVDGFRFSRGGRATTLEGIRGKRLDYIRQMPGAESRRVGRLRAGTGREDERGQEQSLHGQSPVWGTVFRY